MRRPPRRTYSLIALSAFAAVVVGCAGVPSSGASKPGPTAKVTTRATDPSPGSSAPGGSGSTKPSQPKPKLKSPFAGLASFVAATPYHITAAVYDARTGRTWLLDPNPGVPEHTASIVKVEIMGAVLKKVNAAGDPLSTDENSLMHTMIENSDNDSATSLWWDAGGPSAIQRFDDEVGMTGTTASTLQWIPGSDDLPGWGWTTTTALDQVSLVKDFVFPNSLLTTADQSYAQSLMESIEADQDWGVNGGVPAGVTVALKNGWLPLDLAGAGSNWQVNSIGWIHGNGRDYVLAVLTQGGPTEQAGIDAIEHISAQVYERL
ncbi:MAG TPA: serine hydrolase [Streptosporangiaceae bacterium]|jgi:beta-lactamase class A|nr:serine hydrolase [Streptosporangiaceae bacterium]